MNSLEDVTIREIKDDEIPEDARMGCCGYYFGKYQKEKGEKSPKPDKFLILINIKSNLAMLAYRKKIPSEKLKKGEIEYFVIDLFKDTQGITPSYLMGRMIQRFNNYFKGD